MLYLLRLNCTVVIFYYHLLYVGKCLDLNAMVIVFSRARD